MIECGDSIGRDHEQKIIYRIQIADLTSSKKLQVFEFSSDERRQRFRLGRGMTFRLSEVKASLSTHEKSTHLRCDACIAFWTSTVKQMRILIWENLVPIGYA